MRALLAGLLYLYPREWRHRYGAELLTLAEDTQMRWSDPIDLVKGAFAMRIGSISNKPGWQIALALTLVGAVVGGIVATSMRAVYVSSAILIIDSEQQIAGKQFHDVFMRTTTRRGITDLIQQHNLYPELRKRAPLEEVVERFKRDVRVTVAKGFSSVGQSAAQVEFAYEDARTAQRVTDALMAKLIETNAATVAGPTPPITIKTLEGASLPLIPIHPSLWRAVGTGALASLLVGLILGAWTRRTGAPRHHSA